MTKLLTALLIFLASQTAFAGLTPAPTVPSITVGNRVFTDLRNLLVLTGYFNGAGNGNASVRTGNGTAGYAVTAAKTLRITAIRGNSFTSAGGFTFGYSDNDVGQATATAFTNGVFHGGTTLNVINIPVGSVVEMPVNFTIPAGKFPFISNQAGATNGSVTLYGYEE